MRFTLASLALAIAVSCPTWLAAQDDDLFGKLDANQDGTVAASEVPADQKAKFEQLLKIAGKEADQKLSRALFHAALAQLAKAERAAGRPTDRQPAPIDSVELFARLDANQDGFVTGEEVAEPQKALFDRLIRMSDRDGDKKLTKAEFQAGLAPDDAPRQPLAGGGFPGRPGAGANLPGPQQLGEQFDRMDVNKDGKLTPEEVPEDRRLMRQIFERASGTSVTKEQFLRAMAAMGQRPGQPGAPLQRRPDGPPPGAPADALRPALAAIDANRDGELSKAEIEGAAKALLTLDRNGDGQF
jgi:Ca2+-binding EF-hand superfamily protein